MRGVDTNVMLVNAQRNLSSSAQSLASSVQRLSTGLRINSAKDDAAGLALAERMHGQIRGMNVALRNANDGISLVQTAEGGLASIAGSLQSMRELAVQASTSTLSASDLSALNAQAQQLIQEIDRVASSTQFNGENLLGGYASNDIPASVNQTETSPTGPTNDAPQGGSGSGSSTKVTKNDPTTRAVNDKGQTVVTPPTSEPAQTPVETTPTTGSSELLPGFSTKDIQVGANATEVIATGAIQNGTAAALGVAALDLTTAASAALTAIDEALGKVNDGRSHLGALENRLSAAISNLQINAENMTASRNKIIDADVAIETANLSRSQVLQQSSMAMVAQANQMPQGVLALLR